MNKKNIDKVIISARVTTTQDKLLKLYAAKWGIDKSELVVEAIKDHINNLLNKHGVPAGYYPDKDDGVNE